MSVNSAINDIRRRPQDFRSIGYKSGAPLQLAYSHLKKTRKMPGTDFLTALFVVSNQIPCDCPSGYYKVQGNINEGADYDPNFIYLCYSRSDEHGDPITDIYVWTGSSAIKPEQVPRGFKLLNIDLNQGAKKGSKFIYLLYTKSKDQNPLRDITVLIGNKDNIVAPPGWIKERQDLNAGASGKYIYFAIRR